MSVTLREKPLAKGRKRLYLDYYHEGKRKCEILKLILRNPVTKEDREYNREQRSLAEKIRDQKANEINHSGYGFVLKSKSQVSFAQFFEQCMEAKEEVNTRETWKTVLNHIKKYNDGTDYVLNQITEAYLTGFQEYLLANLKSRNSASFYFTKVVTCLNEAVKKKYISVNPANFIDRIKTEDVQREFLEEGELRALVDATCDNPQLRTAFLFMCYTGLRVSDIKALTWAQVQGAQETGYTIRYKSEKASKWEVLPVDADVIQLLGPAKGPKALIFPGFKNDTTTNAQLAVWVARAGILKRITCHCARHTYATLLLTSGAELLVVSKLLGHSNVQTTQVYTRVVNTKKKEAVNLLPKIQFLK